MRMGGSICISQMTVVKKQHTVLKESKLLCYMDIIILEKHIELTAGFHYEKQKEFSVVFIATRR